MLSNPQQWCWRAQLPGIRGTSRTQLMSLQAHLSQETPFFQRVTLGIGCSIAFCVIWGRTILYTASQHLWLSTPLLISSAMALIKYFQHLLLAFTSQSVTQIILPALTYKCSIRNTDAIDMALPSPCLCRCMTRSFSIQVAGAPLPRRDRQGYIEYNCDIPDQHFVLICTEKKTTLNALFMLCSLICRAPIYQALRLLRDVAGEPAQQRQAILPKCHDFLRLHFTCKRSPPEHFHSML